MSTSINSYIKAQKVKLIAPQIDQLECGYGMYIHFGINTFNEIEWYKGDLCSSTYNPTELEALFYWCTANNNVLIVNSSSNQTGKIRTSERFRILELADRLGIRGGEKKHLGDSFSSIRVFKIKEYELQNYNNEKWNTFYTGDLIGACKTINLPEKINAIKIRLNILKSDGLSSISHFAVSKNSTVDISKNKTIK